MSDSRVGPGSCERCASTELLHVFAVHDPVWTIVTAEAHLVRPVGITDAIGDEEQAVGHFETVVCRACGFTRWYAFDWHEVGGSPSVAHCDDCHFRTEHHVLPAYEHTRRGLRRSSAIMLHVIGVERDARGQPERWIEGRAPLSFAICVACNRARWRATELETSFVADAIASVRVTESPPCRHCAANRRWFIDRAHNPEGMLMPIAIQGRVLLGILGSEQPHGYYALQICGGCGDVEWHAQKVDEVVVKEARGVRLLTAQRVERHGPYR